MTRFPPLSFRPLAVLCLLAMLAAGPSASVSAKDLGVRGATWPVAEPDLLKQIEVRLAEMERSGELARFEAEARERASGMLEEPNPVPGIAPAGQARSWTFDPSITVDRDIRAVDGTLIAAAETRIDPFAYVPLSRDLLFVDGRRGAEIAWALAHGRPSKIVLLAGPAARSRAAPWAALPLRPGRTARRAARTPLHAVAGHAHGRASAHHGDRARRRRRGREERAMGTVRLLLLVSALFALLPAGPASAQTCTGRFVNPIADVCWECLFPISIGPRSASGACRARPIPRTRPRRSASAARPSPGSGSRSGCGSRQGWWTSRGRRGASPNLGGLTGSSGGDGAAGSVWHVHYYVYPLLSWIGALLDLGCLEGGSLDIAWTSELDPAWLDDELSFLLNPEAALFANLPAQAACAADCAAASTGLPLDPMFWCAGCQGGMYPLTGNVAAHVGGVQASLLAAQRLP